MLHNHRIKQPFIKRPAFTLWDLNYCAAIHTSLRRPPEDGLVTFGPGDGKGGGLRGCLSYG